MHVTEGGLLAALTVVLGWASAFVPYLSVVLPAPTAVLIYRHGIAPGVMAWLVAVLLVGILMGNVPGAALLALAGLIALGIGEPLRRRMPPGQVLGWAAAGALLWLLGSLVGGLWFMGVNVLEATFQAMESAVPTWLEVYRRMGVQGPQLEAMQQGFTGMMAALRRLLPALFLMSATGSALANYWVVRLVLNRLGENLPWLAPFSRWRSSKVPVAVLLAALALGALASRMPAAGVAGANLSVLAWVVAEVQGLSVLWFWLERASAARPLKGLAVVVLFVFGPAHFALGMVGLMDPWLRFRNL